MHLKKLENEILFKNISQNEIEKMLACSKAKTIVKKKDEYIFRQGDKPEYLFLVIEGTVLLVKDFQSGRRDVLYPVGKNEVFGEMFLFSGNKIYIYDAIAQTNVTCLAIPWKFFYGFCQNACTHHQMITRNMLEIQSEKNLLITRKLHLLSGTSLRERIILWIFDQENEKGIVKLSMNREEFADYLGTTRPSLSRELMKMKQEGLIKLERDEIIVLARDILEQIVGD